MPKLFVKNGEKKGQVFYLNDQQATVGRDPGNTIVISDRQVSRRHACFNPVGQDWSLEDAGSVNGTMVNGRYIDKQPLKFNDEISVGATVMVFLPTNAPENFSAESGTKVKLVSAQETSDKVKVEMSLSRQQAAFMDGALPSDLKALQALYQRLLTVYRISNDLGVVVDLNKLLHRILELVLSVIKADRGFIMLVDEESKELVLQAVYKRPDLKEDEAISLSKTIAQQVIQTGESLIISDAGQDERFKEAQSIVFQGIRSTMCVPIKTKDKILGILYVDTKGKVISFSKADLEMLTAISHQASVAIDNAQLFADVKKANQELKQQQDQLIEAEKLSALGKLASGVAHEINNPMTSIMGYSELTVSELKRQPFTEKETKECLEFVEIVLSEAHRCQSIVQTLLQFGRRTKEETVLLDLNKPIEAALLVAKFHIGKSRVEIIKELAPGLPQISANANQLQQVFLNLIVNARDAMEKGGTLKITSRKIDDHWVEVSFADTGCGIPEDKLEMIFKPLYTTKEEGKGTGLGLSITQDIVERHKGKIEVKSIVGKGTTFTIQLPAAQKEGKSA